MLDINNMKRSDFYYDLPQELIAQISRLHHPSRNNQPG